MRRKSVHAIKPVGFHIIVELREDSMRRTILIPGIIGGLLGLVTSSHLAYATGYGFGTLDVPGGNNTAAFGINDAGQIVGSFASSTGVHGFLYSGGTFTQIDVPSGTYTEAFGINNAGQIVGWYQIDGFAQPGFADTSGSLAPFRSVRPTRRLTVSMTVPRSLGSGTTSWDNMAF
jgi:probable HAF family extracellular repeat protein